jgi:uncharacterized protein (UPF0303 family)
VYFQELFAFAKPSGTKDNDLVIDRKNYNLQHSVFRQCLEEEAKMTYKIKQLALTGINFIIKIKKFFFPQPIIKRKDIC